MQDFNRNIIDEIYKSSPVLYQPEPATPPVESDIEVPYVPLTIRGIIRHAVELMSPHYVRLLPLGIVSAIFSGAILILMGPPNPAAAMSLETSIAAVISSVYGLLAYIAAVRWYNANTMENSLLRTFAQAKSSVWPLFVLYLGLLGIALVTAFPIIILGVLAFSKQLFVLLIPTAVLGTVALFVIGLSMASFGQSATQVIIQPEPYRAAKAKARSHLQGRKVKAVWLYIATYGTFMLPSLIAAFARQMALLPLSIWVGFSALLTAGLFPVMPAVGLALYRAFAQRQIPQESNEP